MKTFNELMAAIEAQIQSNQTNQTEPQEQPTEAPASTPTNEMVAGDSGGNPTDIAAGKTSGDVTGKGPETLGKRKRKTK